MAERTRAARESRAEEEIQSRRTRGLNDGGLDLNLWTVESALDRDAYAYRWVNNTPQRMTKLHKMDDWDPVPEAEVGFPTERHAEIAAGTQVEAKLMRKPKILFDRHHKERETALKAQESALMSGVPANQEGGGLNPRNAYTPNNANAIEVEKT